ncbi:MAG TPA: glycosyltransferase, partial [Acidimicrobiales bacterium]|nr:glycosyltransferase [Acidimicrobiales bacterium]
MRVLVVQETDWVDRNPILHHRMLETLAREGDEVVVVDFDIQWHEKGRWPLVQRRTVITDCHKFLPDADVTVIRPATLRLPAVARPSWILANGPELRRLFRQFRPEVVVAYSISNAWFALRLARRHGVPFVYHVLDALHTLAEPAVLRPVARPVERAVMRGADEVVVINNGLRDYALGMGAPPDRLRVLPMGVDRPAPAVPGADAAAVEATRQALGFGPDDLVLLFMGWLYRFSGLPELLDQLHATAGEMPWLKLLVVGNGDLCDELGRARDRLGLGGRVVLTGRRPVTEMPGFLRAAGVGLLSARPIVTMQHIVPAKVVEYMENANPVIATRLPGLRAEFGDLPGVLYVDGPEGVAAQVRRTFGAATDRRAVAAALGRSCAELMAGRPTWDEVTSPFRDVVHNARRRPAAPA